MECAVQLLGSTVEFECRSGHANNSTCTDNVDWLHFYFNEVFLRRFLWELLLLNSIQQTNSNKFLRTFISTIIWESKEPVYNISAFYLVFVLLEGYRDHWVCVWGVILGHWPALNSVNALSRTVLYGTCTYYIVNSRPGHLI